MDIRRLRELAGMPMQEETEWHGPYGFNTADGAFPLYVEDPSLVDAIEQMSSMAGNDELAYWGGIDRDPEDMYDDEEPIRVTKAEVARAMERLEAAADDEGMVDDDDFLEIWQGELGLF